MHIQAICAAVRSPCCMYTERGALRLLDTKTYICMYVCMKNKHIYIYIHFCCRSGSYAFSNTKTYLLCDPNLNHDVLLTTAITIRPLILATCK